MELQLSAVEIVAESSRTGISKIARADFLSQCEDYLFPHNSIGSTPETMIKIALLGHARDQNAKTLHERIFSVAKRPVNGKVIICTSHKKFLTQHGRLLAGGPTNDLQHLKFPCFTEIFDVAESPPQFLISHSVLFNVKHD